ncbi:SDR family oxidoreductase [Streptomyces sp. NBC_01716]|uniref:SDR family oxidoreductase n=1 Tax=Streptomyces sp. NBC_01716 TaxID=2975917 RepID=UPI002E343173|nr:SDR family NAD(P)-dependent oxidoreductase [Streptomyces sp. NBC_01716]
MSSSAIGLITGGSRGLGRATALKLAESGTDVIITYRSGKDEATSVVEAVEALGRRAVALRLDTTDFVNVKGVMYVVKAVLPHLLEAANSTDRQVADVINISSVAGRVATAGVAIYNAGKFGVTAATEAWRQEFGDRNLRFSVIEPGAVDTELFGHQQGHAKEAESRRFEGVEKLHPEDVADAIAYIATSPRRRAINEIVIRPTDQKF